MFFYHITDICYLFTSESHDKRFEVIVLSFNCDLKEDFLPIILFIKTNPGADYLIGEKQRCLHSKWIHPLPSQ